MEIHKKHRQRTAESQVSDCRIMLQFLPYRNGNFIDDLKALCYYHEDVKSGSDAALDTGPGN